MAEEAIWKGILSSMEMLVLEYKDGSFRQIGQVPDWCRNLEDRFLAREKSAFLDSFLIDAEKFWQNPLQNRCRSGIWIEHDSHGSEYQMEAFALLAGEQKIVVIQRIAPEDRQELVQRAREKSLDNIRLSRLEKRARRSEERIRKFLEALPDWIFRVREDGTLLDLKVSKGREESSFSQFLGKKLSDIFPAEIAADLMQGIQKARETGEIQTSRFQISLDENYESRIIIGDQGEALFILREITGTK